MALATLRPSVFAVPRGGGGGFLSQLHTRKPLRLNRIRARSSAAASVETKPDPAIDAKLSKGVQSLACPICYNSFIEKSDQGFRSFECSTCKKSYLNNGIYLDLTVAGGSEEYAETMPPSTELFRTPLVSFLYERGWRQNFVWGGFPGPEREFEMAKGYLKHTIGGTVIDASCGSGLFSRLFAKSEMNLILVRADISRLPFVSSSIDAVHAGAALHCWPSPSAAVAEVSRVLRPGGVFVATTFILDGFYAAFPAFKILRQLFIQTTSQHLYQSERELEDLCRACGMINFTSVRNGSFVMISATKPS